MRGANLSHKDAIRRIEFVISEARQVKPRYDQTVRMALRVVSNFQSVGRDCGSNYIYKHCPYRSEEAHMLIGVGEAGKKLHNEHQEPLKFVWDWIVERKDDISPVEVESRLLKWPMIVITRDENKKLPKGERDPIVRYRNIVVLRRGNNGAWTPRGQ